MKLNYYLVVIVHFFLHGSALAAVKREDCIVGKWINEQHNLIITVYRDQQDFKAVIVWFHDKDTIGKRPMEERLDTKNPNPELRSKKILGSNVLRNLCYNHKTDKWEHGIIYDATSGKEWQSVAWITKEGNLKVRGYWKLEILGKTLSFNRID